MHVHFSFHHVSRTPEIDKAIQAHVRKLEKLLSRFSPDLVRIHGVLEYSAAHQGPVCSLNLWLPTARLHSRVEKGTPLTVFQDCFDHLIEQVKKHKQFLRREGVWKRRRYKFQQEMMEAAAAEIRLKDRQQLREYLEQVLPQLVQFVARELRYREMGGGGESGREQQAEIVNEVVSRALEGVETKPADSVPPFHRLVSEAIQVLNGPLGPPPGSDGEGQSEAAAGKIGAAHLWRQVRHSVSLADVPPGQPPDPVDLLLASLPPLHRQVYVLHALEGFEWDETARALGKPLVEMEGIFRQVSRQVAATLERNQPASPPAPPVR